MDPKLDVATPERVSVALPIAGLGSRALAHLIDLGLLFAGLLVVFFASSLVVPDLLAAFQGLSGVERAAGGLIVFVAIWGYWTGFEIAWRGQTIGKRAMAIRVVKSDGSPVGVFESAVRNLLRIVDFFPACYPVGLIAMLIDPRHRRVGDLIAGTMLVREEQIDLARYGAKGAPEVMGSFLARSENLSAEAKAKLSAQLSARYHGIEDDPISAFVEKRRPRWEQLEVLLTQLASGRASLADLDALDRCYRQATADLAVAQASYEGTEAARYLNQLCARAYGEIYRSRKNRAEAVKAFFAREFPTSVREELRYVAVAAGLMAVGVVLGAMTVAIAPQGVALFVPEHLQAIVTRGELWTDKLDGSSSAIAVEILTNNLRVTFSAFALGVTWGLGTIATLVFNGLHVGALVTFTFQHDVGWRLLGFMAAHGPVELSVIALAGGAGLMIAHAMIEPGERPRGEALKERAGKAVRIVLGCAPFLALIGVVEGFISPGQLFPVAAKVALGAALAFGFWGYLLRAGRAAVKDARP